MKYDWGCCTNLFNLCFLFLFSWASFWSSFRNTTGTKIDHFNAVFMFIFGCDNVFRKQHRKSSLRNDTEMSGKQTQMNTQAAGRIQSSEARSGGTGGVQSGGFASRAQVRLESHFTDLLTCVFCFVSVCVCLPARVSLRARACGCVPSLPRFVLTCGGVR